MRPTRLGPETPYRHGRVFVGVGVNPEVPTEDPDPPVDRTTDDATAYVPYIPPATGDPTIVQVKQSSTYFASFDSTPTPGNKIFCLVNGQQGITSGTLNLDRGGLTIIGSFRDSNISTDGVMCLGYRDVQAGDPSGPYGDNAVGSNTQTTIIEVSGLPSGAPLNTTGISAQTGTGVSRSITPTGGVSAWLIGAFGSFLQSAFSGTPTFAPNGDTTMIGNLVKNTGMWGIGQMFYGESAGGAVTLGGTQGGTNHGATRRWCIQLAAFDVSGADAGLNFIAAPLTIDDDGATFQEVDADSITAASLVFWRAVLADSYRIASIEASIGFETAGSVTVTVEAGNEADFSDSAVVATATITATGSLTADDVTIPLPATDVYQYWQLLIDVTDGVRVYEVALLDPEAFTGSHEELTGRDAADQHPADSVTVTPFASIAATNVQDALEEIVAEAGSAVIDWGETTDIVNQAMGDSRDGGALDEAARADHKHGMPSFATPAIVLGTAAAAGSAATPIRSDSTIVAFDSTAPVTQALSDAAATGSAAVAARRDHKHGMPAPGDIDVTALDGFPGGTTTWLRADGSFAAPPGSTPAVGAVLNLDTRGAQYQTVPGTNFALTSTDDAVAIPFDCFAPMNFRDVFLHNRDTAANLRTAAWKLYYYDTSGAQLVAVTGADGTFSFTPAGSVSDRSSTASSSPVALQPGQYWLVMRNSSASFAFTLATTSFSSTYWNQTATFYSKAGVTSLGSTLSVSGWSGQASGIAVRLRAGSFGS